MSRLTIKCLEMSVFLHVFTFSIDKLKEKVESNLSVPYDQKGLKNVCSCLFTSSIDQVKEKAKSKLYISVDHKVSVFIHVFTSSIDQLKEKAKSNQFVPLA